MQVAATNYLGRAYYTQGDYRRATECFEWNVASVHGDLVHERFGLPFVVSASSVAWLGVCLAERGEFAQGIARGIEGVRAANTEDHPYTIAATSWLLGQSYLRKGDFEAAIRVFDDAIMLCQNRQLPFFAHFIRPMLGYSYVLSGRVCDGIAMIEEGVQRTATIGTGLHEAVFVTYLSEAYLLAGRQGDAALLAQRAEALAAEHNERGHEAWTKRLIGEIATHADPTEAVRADSYYRQAIALAEELGMRPLAAHCHLGLGTLYRKVDRDKEAQAELGIAAELYRAMEMPFWLARAETELGQIASDP
jgi:tetratricopeptide (TPR) repeat protein